MNKKMSIKGILSILAASTVLFSGLSSCEYKDLGEPIGPQKTKFTLSFDWSKVDSVPRSMRVVFYPKDIDYYALGYTVMDVLNRDTVVELPAGTYDVLTWNNDIEHVYLSTYTNRLQTHATTGNYSPHGDIRIPSILDSLYAGQRILDYPDYMVHGSRETFELSLNDNTHTLVMTPDSMVVTVEVRLHGIKGLQWCNNIRAAVNNVAGKRYIAPDCLTEDTVTVMFDAVPVVEDSLVTAQFWVFGLEPSDLKNLSHKMTFFFWITGNQVFLPVDITKIIARTKEEDDHILIDIDDVKLNLADYVRQGESGWQVDAEDWADGEEIPLDM